LNQVLRDRLQPIPVTRSIHKRFPGVHALILDEPTRGIGIGANGEVHAPITHLAEQAVAIILLSSELPEILGMSHRVLVMRQSRLTADIPRAEATEERIMTAATGQPSLVA
jgi:rhamnose transport system ATP-binding protein